MQIEQLQKKIYTVRGKEVILDVDLAAWYEIDIKRIKTAIKKYPNRFPSDFVFQLTVNEFKSLSNQLGTLKTQQGKSSKEFHYAFTEHGVVILSCSFRSKKIIEATHCIIKAFVQLRERELQNAQLIRDLANKYNKSVSEIHNIIISLLKTLKRSKVRGSENLSSLKATFQHELIQKIFLRRLR